LLVLDSAAALNFRSWSRIPSAAHLSVAWQPGERAWTPRDADEVDAFAESVIRVRKTLVIVVDESGYWINSSRGRGGGLERLYRTARHPDAYVALTTQHSSGDIPRAVISCRPSVYVYSTRPPGSKPGAVPVSLGAIGAVYGIADAEADALPPHQFIFRT
jgi:hypothetical protein